MNIDRLKEEVKRDEGVVFEIYKDHLGHRTFGVGHKITTEDPELELPAGTPVAADRVYSVFERDIVLHIGNAEDIFEDNWDTLPEEVKLIIVNMIFNLGPSGFRKFRKMISAINNQDWKEAAKEGRDSLWYKQVTNRAERLMSRLERV